MGAPDTVQGDLIHFYSQALSYASSNRPTDCTDPYQQCIDVAIIGYTMLPMKHVLLPELFQLGAQFASVQGHMWRTGAFGEQRYCMGWPILISTCTTIGTGTRMTGTWQLKIRPKRLSMWTGT